MQNIFELGSSITVDPKTRKVTHIDGKPVTEHTEAMQAFADNALADLPAPAAENDDV